MKGRMHAVRILAGLNADLLAILLYFRPKVWCYQHQPTKIHTFLDTIHKMSPKYILFKTLQTLTITSCEIYFILIYVLCIGQAYGPAMWLQTRFPLYLYLTILVHMIPNSTWDLGSCIKMQVHLTEHLLPIR